MTPTILLADDEDSIRTLVARILQRQNYKLLVAKDGEEAVWLFQANQDRVDLVLLDVVMPNVDGIRAYERIKTLRPNTKFILMSGDPSRAETVALGRYVDFIMKPFTVEEIVSRIQRTLESKSADSPATGRQSGGQPEPSARPKAGEAKKFKLLIVEDDPAQLFQCTKAFEARGFIVVGVMSAAAAVRLVEHERFDAILTDNIMPGMTGLQAIPLISQKSRAPIILMTSHPSPNLKKDALLLGARAFVTKPLDFDALDRGLKSAAAR